MTMNEDEELAFLLQAAAKNKAKIEQENKLEELPEELFKDLPKKPSEEYPNGDYPTRDTIAYSKDTKNGNANIAGTPNEHAGYRPKNSKQEKDLEYLKEARPLLREAGIAHQKVREWAVSETGPIKVGAKLWDICSGIEEAVRREVNYDPREPSRRCLGFPCGCSINAEAAHYSPTSRADTRTLGKSDVMKIDFGVAIEGNIIDSAFSVCFDDRFKPLIDASRDATNSAIRVCGPDARICEVSGVIEEVIKSYQIELDGKIIPIKPMSNLNGHGLGQYLVHCGNVIPNVKEHPGYPLYDAKMEVGEYYALETFATTGVAYVEGKGAPSHFMINPKAPKAKKGNLRDLQDCILKNFKTMAFSQRFLEKAGQKNFKTTLDKLIQMKIVNPYPPLVDSEGSYVSQYEHCFGIFENGLEVFSRDHE